MNLPTWHDAMRMAFGFCLLFILGLLARGIGLGQIEKESSYGLEIVLGGLISMAGGFVQWAFQPLPPRKEGE